jgi:hypothetical protein
MPAKNDVWDLPWARRVWQPPLNGGLVFRSSKGPKDRQEIAPTVRLGYHAVQVCLRSEGPARADKQSAQAKVTAYIDNQEMHHRQRKFTNEFVALPEEHGISYEERHLWV